MKEIYLTGSVTNWDDPFKWHRNIEQEYTEHAFVNPYKLNDFELGDDAVYDRCDEVVEPAIERIGRVDGMLVRWEEDTTLVGTCMEIREAYQNDVPIVVWNLGRKSQLSPWLQYHTRAQFTSRDKALKALLMWAGDKSVIL
jgi:hypothetical protein